MTRVTTAAAIATALALVAALGGAVASSPVARVTIRADGPIDAIALERGIAVYDVGATGKGCNRLYAWRPAKGKRVQLGGKRTCAADSTSTGGGVTEIALTATHAAWIVNRGGNTESVDTLLTSPLHRSRETRVAQAIRRGLVDAGLGGAWLGGLVSDGSTIAYNRWTTVLDAEGNASPPRSGALRRLTATGSAEIASGLDTLTAAAADGARVAVLRANGSVAVYRTTGPAVRTVTPAGAGRDVALSGDRLAVLTAGRRVELYSVRSGELLAAWPTGASVSTGIDLAGRTLVFGGGRSVYTLDVLDGTRRTLAAHGRAIVDVRIAATGVLYAYNTFASGRMRGNVVFVPVAALARPRAASRDDALARSSTIALTAEGGAR